MGSRLSGFLWEIHRDRPQLDNEMKLGHNSVGDRPSLRALHARDRRDRRALLD